jgi:hypothetical protein
MKQYLMSIYQPDGQPPPKPELDKIMANVRAIRDEAKAAGAWVFSGGLHPASTATVVKAQDGNLLITDGPYTEGKEHVGWFSIIQAPDLDGALEWAKKFARVITLPIEVRPIAQDDSH